MNLRSLENIMLSLIVHGIAQSNVFSDGTPTDDKCLHGYVLIKNRFCVLC